MTTPTLDVLLLLALPASGKSEIRRYLDHLDPAVARADLRLGRIVGLDDYPYVHLMRRLSQELRRVGADPVFFEGDDGALLEPRDWGTLVHLLNEDHAGLGSTPSPPQHPGRWLLDRIDRARAAGGAPGPSSLLPAPVRAQVEDAIAGEAMAVWQLLADAAASVNNNTTVVIEFARGGPEGAVFPLDPPLGYGYSLGELSPSILERAVILYVLVTPEESRRRNRERARPGVAGDASILFHGVPDAVMHAEYGCDDLLFLVDRDGGRSISVVREDRSYEVPVAVFDNRADGTSFLRSDPAEWPPDRVAALHSGLATALVGLAR